MVIWAAVDVRVSDDQVRNDRAIDVVRATRVNRCR